MSNMSRHEYRVDQCWPENLEAWLNSHAVYGWQLASILQVEDRHYVVLERATGEPLASTSREPHGSFGPPRTKGDTNE